MESITGMLRAAVLVVAVAVVARKLTKLAVTSAKRKANHGRSISTPDETGAHAFVLTNHRNVQLYCRRWGSLENAKASILLVHSELLNGSFFKPFAEKSCEKGYICYSLDLTGFGKSGCQSGLDSHIQSYEDYVEDIECIVDVIKQETENRPIVLYGEGLGGTCCLAYVMNEANNDKISALVVASPTLEWQIPATRIESGWYGFIGKIFPQSPGPKESIAYEIEDLFTDEEIGVAARENFEKLQPATLQKIKEMHSLLAYVVGNFERVRLPLLVVHGENDVRNDPKMSEKLKIESSASQKYLRILKDGKHGLIYGDVASTQPVYYDILAFLSRNLDVSESK